MEELKKIISERRSLRSLGKFDVSEEVIQDLATSSQLAPSCSNKQPWRYVYIYGEENLKKFHPALTGGNYWAKEASLLIVVFSHKDYGMVIKDREYYLYDTGTATAFMILRAWEMGLVAHPMAGFSPSKAKQILNIPDDMMVLSVVAVGKRIDTISDNLSEKHREDEKNRPLRKAIDEFVYRNTYK
jgi:nitroreductase